jgi:histone H3/H4
MARILHSKTGRTEKSEVNGHDKIAFNQAAIDKCRRLWTMGYDAAQIAKLPNMPCRQTIHEWVKIHGWREELDEIMKKVKQKRIEMVSDEIAKMDVEQLNNLAMATNHIVEHLGQRETIDAKDLKMLVESLSIAIKNERLIRGEVTDRTSNQIDGKLSISWENIIYATANKDI